MKARGTAAALITGAMMWVVPSSAQTPGQLAEACTVASGAARFCTGAAVGARAIQSQVGLLAGTGVEIPGTATTLGTRVGGGPRLAFSLRAGLVDMSFPDLSAQLSDPLVTREAGAMATAVHGRASAGFFDGFQLMPTVGGFLSLDVFGQASLLFVPEDEELTGGSRSYSAGVRIGVLREGFTVPGISVSVAKRFPEDVSYLADGDVIEVEPGVISYRAVLGKDLFAIEWLAGVGYDEYDGNVTLDVVDSGAVGSRVTISAPLGSDRLMYFGGASTTLGIVLTLSIEAGWAEGFEALPGWDGPHDQTSGTLFGGLAARLTL